MSNVKKKFDGSARIHISSQRAANDTIKGDRVPGRSNGKCKTIQESFCRPLALHLKIPSALRAQLVSDPSLSPKFNGILVLHNRIASREKMSSLIRLLVSV